MKMTARTMLTPAMVYSALATVSKNSMLAPLVLFVFIILIFAGKSYVGDFPGIKDVFHVFVMEINPFVVVGVMHVDVAVFFFEDKHVVKFDCVFRVVVFEVGPVPFDGAFSVIFPCGVGFAFRVGSGTDFRFGFVVGVTGNGKDKGNHCNQ